MLAGLRSEDSIAELSYGHDLPMVLLNDVAQVFVLADFNTFVMVSIKLFQPCLVYTTLINVNETRLGIFPYDFSQKTQCNRCISFDG